MFDAQRGALRRLSDATPARGSPAACEGKSHDVKPPRSCRPSISHASAGTTDCAGEAVGAMVDGTPPGHMNGVRRGRYVKVKICLGKGESPKEAADLCEGRVRPSSIPQVKGGGGIRELQRFADGGPRQFRVRIRCIEDVPASGRVVDRHIERGTPDDP